MAGEEPKMTGCIFCKILKGDIPSEKVYEDAHVVGFLDIAPVHPGHTLLIPRRHAETLFDTHDEDLGKLLVASKKVGKALMEATGADGLNVGINAHKAAGQVVFHTHLHLIPRHEGDGLKSWPHKSYAGDEQKEWAEKIRNRL